MKKIDKKFFGYSALAHIIGIALLLIINSNNNINNRFVVFGVHSQKPTQASFRPLKKTNSSDWLKKRKVKPIIKKTPIKKIVKRKPIPKKKPIIKQPTKKISIKSEQKKIIAKKAPTQKIKINTTLEKNIPPSQLKEELRFSLLEENDDPQLIMYQKHIQKEVGRLWKPPVGVPKGTECSMSFNINSDGKVEDFEAIKRSKVLIYDLSILRIANQFNFDKCLWNKKFTIDFRQ